MRAPPSGAPIAKRQNNKVGVPWTNPPLNATLSFVIPEPVTFSDFAQKGCLSTSPPPDCRPGPWHRSSPLSDPLLSVIPSEAEGTCGAPEPKTKALTSEVAGVAQTVVAWERGCPQFATPGFGTNGRTSRGLSSRVNGEVREEQTVRARSANSLVGAFVLGSGAPQVPRLRSG